MDIKRLLNKDFLEKLKYKLSTGNARSIYLNCIPGRYKGRLELSELESVIPSCAKDFLNTLLTNASFSFEIDIPSIDEEDEEVSKEVKDARLLLKARLEYMIAEDKTIKDNLGISTFNFGYPVIAYKKARDSKFIYAPLLLWEFDINRNFKKKNSYILTRTTDSSVRFNDMFTILLEDDAQIKVGAIDEELLADGFLDEAEVSELINRINKQVFRNEDKITLEENFPKLDKDVIISNKWINTGVFGHFRHLKTPIIKEIKRLIQEIDEENITFLDSEFKTENFTTSLETDPSQKKIIDSLSDSKHKIIQGPPGTGKSQTITAIISNVLANNGKCLVVCEKDAALNVIKENLDEIGISKRMVLKITDPIMDRRLFGDFMSSILDTPQPPSYFQNAAMDSLSIQNQSLRTNINSVKDKLYSNGILGTPFRDLIGRLTAINRNYEYKQGLSTNFENYKDANLENLKKIISSLEPKFRKIQTKLEVLSQFENEYILHLNPLDYNELQESLQSLKKSVGETLSSLRNTNQQTNNKFFGKDIKISIFEKVLGIFSSDIKLLNESIETLTKQLAEIKTQKEKIPVVKRSISMTTRVSEKYNELNSQAEYIEQILGVDRSLMYDYKELLSSVKQLDNHSAQIYRDIISNPELHIQNNWDVLFEKSVIEYFLRNDLKTATFYSGDTINSYIDDLIDGEDKERKLNTEKINSAWKQGLSTLNLKPNWSSTKFYLIQKRQSPKRGPRKSLQNLFKSYSEDILTISPVILTNPITASVLFADKEKLFDVVLFDEASQLRLEDTITCMLLGKKIVISGDKHQMPPSDYFDNGITLDEEPEEEEIDEEPIDPGAESLLAFSYTLSNYFEDRMLECHYRSRHPDLIGFSNHAFYDGRLLPMPAFEKEPPIKFIQVNGIYQQKKRINLDEAKAVVELLKSTEITEDKSVGIATLNITQRDLIREVLTEEMEKDEVFRNKIIKLQENGMFLKNLENIQGDERDIIILSVTFGVNESKKFSAFFGQLNNKNKGYKLLNVLVTRAKHKLIIFNSIPEIEFGKFAMLRPNKSEILSGRGALYAYLAYAQAVSKVDIETKRFILGEIGLNTDTKPYERSFSESPFEEEVYNSLLEKLPSERIIQQYEAGGFFIDMVILDEKCESPMLAIECDGAAYHSSEDAYAWDLYRQKMLERMGFKFHRVWSTDWWIDDKEEVKKILENI
jgi:superfamily I DNA and/or RNA helicase/very-short-patch-repair endonuclease